MLIIKKGNLLQALQAAIAFPGIFTPVRFGDRFLVDGGLCNPVPADVVRELGADTVIGVCAIPEVCKAPAETYLPAAEEENEGGKGHPFELFNAVRVESVLMDLLRRNGNGKKAGKDSAQRKPPSLFRVCAQSVVIMENQINQLRLERNDIDLLIRPDLKSIGLLDFHRAEEAIQAGETATARVADRLRALAGDH
jgi:NTE family protein